MTLNFKKCKTIGHKLVLVKNSIENVGKKGQKHFRLKKSVYFEPEGQVHGRPEDNTKVKKNS